jgi:hypothetical protein
MLSQFLFRHQEVHRWKVSPNMRAWLALSTQPDVPIAVRACRRWKPMSGVTPSGPPRFPTVTGLKSPYRLCSPILDASTLRSNLPSTVSPPAVLWPFYFETSYPIYQVISCLFFCSGQTLCRRTLWSDSVSPTLVRLCVAIFFVIFVIVAFR